MINITTLVTGLSGIAALQITPELLPKDPTAFNLIIQTIIQVIIGIATLWGLFKKRNK